jgi:hypothetical protein
MPAASCRNDLSRLILLFGLFLAVISSNAVADGTTWHPLRIGAGGFLTSIDISSDGSTRIVRTDTYGAYIWNNASSQWTQLVTTRSMPAVVLGVDNNQGVYEIRVAPSLPGRLYMAYRGYVYRSNNTGSTWARTAFANVPMSPNDNYRMYGQKMAVDPSNPDVVYVGTPQNGLFVTNDGGTTWQSVAAVPLAAPASNGQYPGITGIAFDPTSGATGGKTNIIYASSYGNGVYQSSDAGATWTLLRGGPSNVSHAKIARDGGYYVAGNDNSSVWRYLSGTWMNITPSSDSWVTVVTDPFDATRVVAIRDGGYLDISHDRGATWGGIIWGQAWGPACSQVASDQRVATDMPWLAWTNECFMTVGDMLFDPATPNRLWFAEGIGVWYTDVPNTAQSPTSTTFTSQSMGIEQLVANVVVAPPGGEPVVGSWDRPVFYVANPDVFPSTHGPDNQTSIVMGWDLDYASTSPAFIIGLFNWGVEKSGYSTDGGQTWTPFASYPPTIASGKIGGGIAASTPTNFVWAPSNNGSPYYTKDGGATWIQTSIPGVPTTGETGWGWAYYLNRHIVTADRVTAGTFYIYNYLTGLYRSTDGGASWALVYSGQIAPSSGFNARLRSVPGQAGHLFFTSGPQGNPGDPHPAANPFMRSTNGGATWSAVPNVLEVRAFGFGAPLASYPAIFIAGWVNNVYGLWRSDDNAQTWTQIGDFPLGSLDDVTAVEGDKNVYGTVYVGFAGSGYAYGTIPVSAAPAVAINSPANGTRLKRNSSVNIAASASDPSGIASISIMGDSTVLQTCSNTTSCSATWQGKTISSGTHTITAVAMSNAGMQASASVTVYK